MSSDVDDAIVVEVEARNGVTRAGFLGLFLDADYQTLRVELDDAVALRITKRARRYIGSSVISWPSSEIVPVSGESSPVII